MNISLKNDLIFKIGTLFSFFLLGIDYISQCAKPYTYATIFLNIFIVIVAFIILICVIYHFYSLFSYKDVDFSIVGVYDKGIVIRISNNLNRHIIIDDINEVIIDDTDDTDDLPFFIMPILDRHAPDDKLDKKYLILENETRDLHIFYNGDLSNLKEINLGFLLMPNNIEYFSENYDSLYEKSLRNFSVNRELTKSEKKIINKIYKN